MPTVKVNGICMHYEVHGQGEPLVFINGAGASMVTSYWLIPIYSRDYRLVLFDNRGVGQTDKPDMTYTTQLMANDLAGLLDAIGIDSAHVYGTSMGGMVAQEFALRYQISPPSSIKASLVSLIKKGILFRTLKGNYQFIDNFMPYWIDKMAG